MIWLIRLVPAVMALVCIVLAFVPVRRGRIAHPVTAKATVTGSRTQMIHRNGSEVTAYAPVVRYETASGEITAASREYVPEWQYRYHPGDALEIVYDRQQPDLFVLKDTGGVWRRTALLTAGIGTLIAGAVLWLQYH
ncbi:MAG: DUF3592 domain-containing protein [Oscillospiraceae bacterium]|nr:DUF3592 domain-containing protein [Oscillospiraceae bacterium]